MMGPKVSIIVPGHNASKTLKSSLSSLRSQDWPKDCLEIVYVDDASTDESIEVASEWADRIVRLAGIPNGPAGARNSGARESSGEIIVFIDADVLAPPGTIRALVKPLMEDETLDAIFGSYDSEPMDPTLVSQYRNLLHHFVHQTSRRNAATFWAGCGAIRRRSFETAGGLDAARYQGAMIEDIELGHRMRALGMQIRLQPSIQVKHLKKWTLLQMVRSDIFSRGIPWMRLLFQEGRASGELGDLNLRVSGLLSVALAWMGAFFLPLSLWFPKFLYGAGLALAVGLLINMPTYRFFWKSRGLRFALMIIPLHVLYNLYNGASVIGALLYRCLLDRPLPGLESLGANLRARYWRRISLRRRRAQDWHLPVEQDSQHEANNNPRNQSDDDPAHD
jgi:glycosyltransferase involved in cell wall biosynthesis